MESGFAPGTFVKYKDGITPPNPLNAGLVGRVIEAVHRQKSATHSYVRFSNGDEGWTETSGLVTAAVKPPA